MDPHRPLHAPQRGVAHAEAASRKRKRTARSRFIDDEASDDVDLDLSDIEGSGLADELADLDSNGYDANDSFIAADDDAAAVAAASDSDSDDAAPVRRRRSSRRRRPARR